MALLTRTRTLAALGALALVAAGGCMLVDALVQSERPLAFDHHLHVDGQGLDCTDCHGHAQDADDPGLPAPAQCALCHAEIDAKKPPERRVAALFDGERFRATRATHLDGELRFSHRSHAARASECTACHAAVAADEGHLAERRAELAPSMAGCVACHASSAGPREADCAACHERIRVDVAPPSHAANWRRYHGTVVHAGADAGAERCALCHATSSCETCHELEKPASHDEFWRRRGHGLDASMDRESCATCHDSDSCQRCHEDTRPANHLAQWGAPRDRHCLTCHDPLRADSCGVCHATASSHDLATPLPGDHLPGMNCRQCHGHGQPLPHVDNGESCTACHR